MYKQVGRACNLKMNHVLKLHYQQAKYVEAERLYGLALVCYEKTLGVESPEVALAFHALAELFQKLARYPQAEVPMNSRTYTTQQNKLTWFLSDL